MQARGTRCGRGVFASVLLLSALQSAHHGLLEDSAGVGVGLTHHKGPHSLVPTHLGSSLLSLQELVMGKAGLPWEAGICISAPTGEGCSASLSFGCWCQDP